MFAPGAAKADLAHMQSFGPSGLRGSAIETVRWFAWIYSAEIALPRCRLRLLFLVAPNLRGKCSKVAGVCWCVLEKLMGAHVLFEWARRGNDCKMAMVVGRKRVCTAAWVR